MTYHTIPYHTMPCALPLRTIDYHVPIGYPRISPHCTAGKKPSCLRLTAHQDTKTELSVCPKPAKTNRFPFTESSEGWPGGQITTTVHHHGALTAPHGFLSFLSPPLIFSFYAAVISLRPTTRPGEDDAAVHRFVCRV